MGLSAQSRMICIIRPVVIVQIDLLNNLHGSTIICPITSQVNSELKILRVHIGKRYLEKESDVLVDQSRAIDNRWCNGWAN